MNKKVLLKRIEDLFFERLKIKTGWGKNEVRKAYSEAVNEALMEALDDLDQSPDKNPVEALNDKQNG